MLKLLKYFRPIEWLMIFLTVGLVVLQVELTLTIPEYLEDIIALIGQSATSGEIWKVGGIMIGLAACEVVVIIAINYLTSHVGAGLARTIRRKVFGQVEDFIEENGWIEVDGNLNERMFVVKACGDSMKGDIENEDYCVFQNYDTGHSYEGKIVLSQIHEQDSDYKGSYTIKYYHRDKVWDDELNREIAKRVVLSPSNHAYPPIVIDQNPENYRVIGEFIKKL